VPNAMEYKDVIRAALEAEAVQPAAIEWIAPTLEDVFISCVTAG